MALKIKFQTRSKIWIEFDANDTREAVAQLANLQNVFDECQCGVCGGTELRYVHTENGGFHFYELHCLNPKCRAKLNFGQRKEDHELFPRRKDDKKNYLPNKGWQIYNPDNSPGEGF